MTQGGVINAGSGARFAGRAGRVRKVIIGPWIDAGGNFTNTSTIAIGHIQVQNTMSTMANLANPLNAWQGEKAGTRFARLCSENNIPCRVYGYPHTTAAMRQQTSTTPPTLPPESATPTPPLT